MTGCERMVREQVERRGIADPRVLEAMRRVDRALFVPRGFDPYADAPQGIGCGQTISQPFIVALMLEALRLRPGERLLEVGVGSGYAAALAAAMGCRVFGIERHAALTAGARAAIRRAGLAVTLVTADGTRGWPGRVPPFDAVLVSAAAPRVPEGIRSSVRVGGRLVAPVGDWAFQDLRLEERGEGGAWTSRSLEWVRFVPLVTGPAPGS